MLELINKFIKVSGYKINLEKSIEFLLTNKEIKKTIPFIIVSKRINLTKEEKDIHWKLQNNAERNLKRHR